MINYKAFYKLCELLTWDQWRMDPAEPDWLSCNALHAKQAPWIPNDGQSEIMIISDSESELNTWLDCLQCLIMRRRWSPWSLSTWCFCMEGWAREGPMRRLCILQTSQHPLAETLLEKHGTGTVVHACPELLGQRICYQTADSQSCNGIFIQVWYSPWTMKRKRKKWFDVFLNATFLPLPHNFSLSQQGLEGYPASQSW